LPEIHFCRSVRFCASHRYALAGNSEAENRALFGAAAVVHEHIWTLTIWLRGPIEPATGMMVDLTRVDEVLACEVLGPFDGAHINDVDICFQQTQPTTEVLAGYFAGRLADRFGRAALVKLRLAESADIFAEWHA